MRRFLNLLYKASGWFGACCIAAICLLVVCQVMLNLLDRISALLTGSAIGLTIPSYADFTGFLLAAASFMALAYSLRDGAHIRVSLIIGRLPERFHRPVEMWCILFGLSISLYFSWYTAKLTHESFTYNDLSAGMIAVPIWIPQTALLLGLIVLSIALMDELATVLRGNVPSYMEKGEGLLAKENQQDQSAAETCGGDDV
ncbi:MAG: TRAP transporter small permease [Deltaproteobacteria bacterium]|nr:TRAP transporter small permease [Deltaproteobacteria bacterium]MBW2596143.1 TRAP transporter small permease [Deltaproteobacteria bacterium]MBW2649781.1 TRAP transporter small permease [Deltaproteobacteria bacterium]